jgi:signal peptidase II
MAMRAVPPNRYIVFSSIAITGCVIDLATKHLMFRWLGWPDTPVKWIIPGVFGFRTSVNEGALFGFGQGWVWLFSALSVLAAVGILVWLFYAGAARDWLLTVALGCVTAGIFGNLYDRCGLHGLRWPPGHPIHPAGTPVYAVRDWIHVMIGQWPWPTFNIADSLLVCGAVMLLWHALFCGDPRKSQEA